MADNNGDNKDVGLSAETVQGLTDVIQGLPKSLQDAVMIGVNQAVAHANEKSQAEADAKDDDDDGDDDTGKLGNVDLEGLSRREFADHIAKVIVYEVKRDIKDVSSRVDEEKANQGKQEMQRAVEKAKVDHPDFMDWADEMRGVLKTNPGLRPEELYLLAKAKNPEKVKKVEEAEQEVKTKEEEEKKKTERPVYGGLTPTSLTSEIKSQKMTKDEAISDAWESSMKDLPKILLEAND